MSRVSLKNTADTDEIFDVFGPRIQFLTALSENDDDYCLIQGTVPAGVIVPLHSHGERETFYVVAGEIQGLCEDRWITFGVGDVFDVPGGLKHAWRNVSGASVSLLFAMPMRLGRFFRDIARPVAMASQDAPKPADFQRLLVTATAPEAAREPAGVRQAAGETTYAEVAHEAIFRRWDRLREWVATEREFLAWRSGLEAARRGWQATATANRPPRDDALLMGAALTQAESWLLKRAEDLPASDHDFIAKSIEREKKAREQIRRIQALVCVLIGGVIVSLVAWMNETRIRDAYRLYWIEPRFAAAKMRPLAADAERALKPDPEKSFWECVHDVVLVRLSFCATCGVTFIRRSAAM
jgi:quercetin dioxygenase-like cupin family protein